MTLGLHTKQGTATETNYVANITTSEIVITASNGQI